MSSDEQKLRSLIQSGYCCSEALVAMGLYFKGSKNQELLDASKALCRGMRNGLLCGALSGAGAMICLLMPEEGPDLLEELVDWFDAKYAEEYGSMNCDDILEGNLMLRPIRCPELIVATYLKSKELLEFAGYSFPED